MAVVGIDVDGVLADFVDGFARRLEETSGRLLFPGYFTWQDVTTWNYAQTYGYTPAEIDAAWESVKADKSFWVGLNPHDETRAFLTSLLDITAYKDDVYFITHRMGIQAKQQTETWLRMNGWSDRPTVLLASGKGWACKVLDVDYYVDDKRSHVVAVRDQSPDTHVSLLKRGWNSDVPGVPTISSLSQFINLLQVDQLITRAFA